MMIKVKKIQPKELPTECLFRLNYLYHAEPGNFVAITDRKDEILYVNHTVPQKDIEGFLEVIEYPEYAVAQPETKTGEFLDYVYDEYGTCAYLALMDAHSSKMKQREKKKAEEVAKAILPIIEKEVNSEEPIIKYDENLIYEIWSNGNEIKKKNSEKYCRLWKYIWILLRVSHGSRNVERSNVTSA